MKLTDIIKVLFLSLAMAISASCETYVLLPIKVSDFKYYYNNEIRALFEDFHASYSLAPPTLPLTMTRKQ